MARTRREMRLTAEIGEYEMDKVILDLGSDANALPKQTWEIMGRLALQWYPIQLRMENQKKIIPNNENNPYPELLGINWAIDMNGMINLKK